MWGRYMWLEHSQQEEVFSNQQKAGSFGFQATKFHMSPGDDEFHMYLFFLGFEMLLMAEILHHLGCKKSCK